MSSHAKKPIIGIIGGMYSGKSTAAAEFAKFGCAVIDADDVAHEVLKQQDVQKKVVRLFGKEILDAKGRVSRPALAYRVFGDPGKLEKLTEILHPIVLSQVKELTGRYNEQGWVRAIILDMPLLLEVGWKKYCDYVIFIDCKAPIRLERAKKTGVFDADQLKVRENQQISLDKKKRIADNIVDNNSDLSGLSKQIASLFSSIMDKR